MKFIISISALLLTVSAVAQSVSSEERIKCELTFLQVNGDIFGLPGGKKDPYEITLKMNDTTPFYQKWGGYWEQKIPYGKDKEMTLRTHFTLMANASLWYFEPRFRLQMFSLLTDASGNVLSVIREHTDRVVREYQIEEIGKDKPTLRLAIPIPLDWNQLFTNEEVRKTVEVYGYESALTQAHRSGLIPGDYVKEMGVLCSRL